MIAMNMTFTFYIGDGIEGRKFASRSISVKAVGTNETKAYNEGIKQIRVSDPELIALIEEGKKKIVEYYTTHCDAVIKMRNPLLHLEIMVRLFQIWLQFRMHAKPVMTEEWLPLNPCIKIHWSAGVMWNWQKRELHGMLSKMVMVPRKPAQR